MVNTYEVWYGNKNIGLFAGDSAQKAGSKGFTVLMRKEKSILDKSVTLKVIHEQSRATEYFDCQRQELPEPCSIKLPSGQDIVYKYRNSIKESQDNLTDIEFPNSEN